MLSFSLPEDLLVRLLFTSAAACAGGIVYSIGRSKEHKAQVNVDALIDWWKKYNFEKGCHLETDKIFERAIAEQKLELERAFKCSMLGIGIEILAALVLTLVAGCEARHTAIEIAKNDPRNLPLDSVMAYVTIEYKTNKVETNFWDRNLSLMVSNGISPTLSLETTDGDSIILVAGIGGPFRSGVMGPNDGKFVYLRRLDWDAIARGVEIKMEEMLGQKHKPMTEMKGNIADSIMRFNIYSMPFSYKTEVTGGTIELFFNGTIRKQFSIPPQWIDAPSRSVESAPNPFLQKQLGATNWSYLDLDGVLQTTSLPPMTLKSFTITKSNSLFPSTTWNNVPLFGPRN
jgi:hypothetical protein